METNAILFEEKNDTIKIWKNHELEEELTLRLIIEKRLNQLGLQNETLYNQSPKKEKAQFWMIVPPRLSDKEREELSKNFISKYCDREIEIVSKLIKIKPTEE